MWHGNDSMTASLCISLVSGPIYRGRSGPGGCFFGHLQDPDMAVSYPPNHAFGTSVSKVHMPVSLVFSCAVDAMRMIPEGCCEAFNQVSKNNQRNVEC